MTTARTIALRLYIALVCTGALCAVFVLSKIAPSVPVPWSTLSALALLAISAELLADELPRGGVASVAFMPLIAAALLAPSTASVLILSVSGVAVRAIRQRDVERALFNLGQAVACLSVAAIVYVAARGTPMIALTDLPFGQVVLDVGVQCVLALLTFLVANSIIVAVVIAIHTGQSAISVWRTNNGSTVAHLVFALPGAFVLAWMGASVGAAGVAMLSVPMLGMRQLYRATHDLQKVNQELLELMIKAIEARDPYTSGHSRRVSETARVIAGAMGMSGAELERVTVAALLHDVGKIHEVFAPILQKPGRLTDEEWDLMKTHPARGAELVTTVSHLRYAVPSIRGHHENWDGTGYPDGLAGDRIPIGARVITVADTIDALTSDRPYRKRLTPADVRAELVRCRGTQFDPAVCDAVLTGETWKKLFPEVEGSAPSSILALRRRSRPSIEVAGL
jgi:hypothetical protein